MMKLHVQLRNPFAKPSRIRAKNLRAAITPGQKVHSCRIVQTKRLTSELLSAAADVSEVASSAATVELEHPVAAAADAEQQDESQFDYARQWYPVFIVEDLDPKVPMPVVLLGKDLVVWRDAGKVWRCFEDICPHRLVALSEGRIDSETGALQCAYHGWGFNGEGACTSIPQIGNEKAHATAIASARSCVKTHPTQEAQGLLWVWGMAGPSAAAEAAATAPALLPELLENTTEGEKWEFNFRWFMRDVPYSYDVLLENAGDPSHVPFAHHGVQGNRAKPTRYTTSFLEEPTKDKGFTVQLAIPGQDAPFSNLRFIPPSLLSYRFLRGNVCLNVYAVPTKPGYARIIASGLFQASSSPLFFRLYRHIPKWLDHALQRNEVLDGDSTFLRIGEERLRAASGEWKKAFYMPATADGTIQAIRTWLDTWGGQSGPCSGTGQGDLPRLTHREAIDRFDTHTKHCPSCQRALKVFTILQKSSLVAAVMCLVAAAAAAKASTGLAALVQWQSGAWLAAAAALLLLRGGFKSWAEKFVYTDYVHAHK